MLHLVLTFELHMKGLMAELLRNSSSVITTSNRFACQARFYGRPTTCDSANCCRKYSCCLFDGLAIKSNSRRLALRTRRMSLLYGFTKKKNLIISVKHGC
ncbi:hypothetical protein Dsin_030011 [Dipteronia sinensis]|uniref:Uncharacterized protein n=1 Tax=Dipteronia sinensis TaxID=43782 RepID=A0AAD9ZIJ5_9ROSI|nr:hypothetical protein Dsin_030011 [Dipteronia sinensis]